MTQTQYTNAFIRALGIPESEFKTLRWAWWQNPTREDSYRLTETGFEILANKLEVEHHQMRIRSSLGKNLRVLLLLEQHINSPFYIKRRDQIVFFGDQHVVMLSLMDNDLDQYLSHLSQ
jgi:hypothetical protein